MQANFIGAGCHSKCAQSAGKYTNKVKAVAAILIDVASRRRNSMERLRNVISPSLIMNMQVFLYA